MTVEIPAYAVPQPVWDAEARLTVPFPGVARAVGGAHRAQGVAGARRDGAHSILVVDDDRASNRLMASTMAQAGYRVHTAFNGGDALRTLERRAPELMLLDPTLPDIDGLEVLRRLRRFGAPSIGVIVVTERAAEHHRLAGFAAGADDYVAKPCSPAEVAARAAGILRRLTSRSPASSPPLIAGPLRIERAGRRVTCSGTVVDLTRLQYRLLLDLASRAGVIRTHEQLIVAAWGSERLADTSTVTVHIHRLRSRLLAAGAQPELIETVRGLGYRCNATVS